MIASLRAALPVLAGRAFLNYAGNAPLGEPAALAMEAVLREARAPLRDHFDDWVARVERARTAVATLVNAGADEIAFTTSTSTALSIVAGAVRWKPGDRVLYPADEFASNRWAWTNLAALGVRAEAVPVERGVPFAAQLARTDLAGARLIAMSAVSYRDGRRLDVADVAALAHARGILVSVDAIQAVGAVPADVRAWGADFVACGAQKWLLGPVGAGFLWIARERLPELHAPLVGWASSQHAGEIDAEALTFVHGAARLEPGLPDVTSIAGLGTAAETLLAAGLPAVHAAVAAHHARLAAIAAAHGVEVIHDGPAGATAGILTVRDPHARFAAACAAHRVDGTFRPGEARFSAHACTSDEDFLALERAFDDVAGAARVAVAMPAPRDAAPTDAASPGAWRRALVTGASRGLGAAIAARLADEGCALVLLGRDATALEAVAAPLRARVDVTTAAVDLADDGALERWLAEHASLAGGCDLLVNAAAHAEAATFEESGPGPERTAFQVNVFAPQRLARAVLPGLRERGRGAILNVATTGARNALPLFSAYAASKAALWAWSEALGRELQGSGVTVTTFVPPHMDTATRRQLGRRALGRYDTAGAQDATTPVDEVAREALDAAREGRATAVRWGVRWQHAMDALAPSVVARQVALRWRGGAR